jgi:hypothetical protein
VWYEEPVECQVPMERKELLGELYEEPVECVECVHFVIPHQRLPGRSLLHEP